MAFLFLVLVGGPSGLRKAFSSVIYLVSEVILFMILFRVRKFVDAVGLFEIIPQCSFKAFLSFLAYLRSTKTD